MSLHPMLLRIGYRGREHAMQRLISSQAMIFGVHPMPVVKFFKGEMKLKRKGSTYANLAY